MKSVVIAILLLYVIVSASTFAVRDLEIDDEGVEQGDRQHGKRIFPPGFPFSGKGSPPHNLPPNYYQSHPHSQVNQQTVNNNQYQIGSINTNNYNNHYGTAVTCYATTCTTTLGVLRNRKELDDQTRRESSEIEEAAADQPMSDDDPRKQLQTVVANVETQSLAVFRDKFNEKVVKAELYIIPPSILGSVYTGERAIEGVLVTLTDGQKFMITHGQEILGEGGPSAILKMDELTENWEFVKSKDVQSSILSDYIKASDSSLTSKDAAEKMMELA